MKEENKLLKIKVKVLFIHNKYEYKGGEDKAVQLESELLKNNGHCVRIIYFDNKSIKKSSIISAFEAVYNNKSKKLINKEIKLFKPDIIHVHNFFFIASPSIFTAAKKANIPIVLTLHNYRLICCNALLLRENKVCELCVNKKLPLDGIKYKCYRSSFLQSALVTLITSFHKIIGTWNRNIDNYITLTDFSRNRFINSSLNISENKFKVLPNFVEDNGYGKFPREDYFLFVGRIANEKGISIALQCFAQLPNQKLIIAGEGPELEILKINFAKNSNIYFIGKTEANKINELMKKCKALIFPSIWYEGLPFTIIEAFAAGTPVIASNLGAMSELIIDGYNGYHFIPNNSDQLKKCVIKFVALHQFSEQIYENARKSYESNFNNDRHYKGLIQIYQKCLSVKR